MLKNKRAYVSILFLFVIFNSSSSSAIEFNSEMLDSQDKKAIDISRFSQKGYVLPGDYLLRVFVNGSAINSETESITFVEKKNNKDKYVQACISEEITNKLGLKKSALENISISENGCRNFSKLRGVEITPNISESRLYISVPQIWLEYDDGYWIPPSRWEDGIPGMVFDYNTNLTARTDKDKNNWDYNLGYNGIFGLNYNAWRLRSEYQGNVSNESYNSDAVVINRTYLYRAITDIQGKLTVGESSFNSDIFSPWDYTGIGIESDDRMLPPKLRGYAPEIKGVAETNARVVVSNKGRIVYDSTVPAGPFLIQDLDSSLRGVLDVEVIEQDGRVKKFSLNSTAVPYLTRPGHIKYKAALGKSRYLEHELEGPVFFSGEASYGVSNDWSLYGGVILTQDEYNAFSIGLGRDLGELGTISLDASQSIAKVEEKKESKKGKSWRLSYSKSFDQSGTDIQFAGYKYSEPDYMTMQQFLDSTIREDDSGREKELYSISLTKNFEKFDSSLGFQVNHQTYWDKEDSDYYSVSYYKYFDAFDFKDISFSISATISDVEDSYNEDNVSIGGGYTEKSYYMRISVPIGKSQYVNLNSNMSNSRYSNTVGFNSTSDDGLESYSLSAGINSGGQIGTNGTASAYYSKTTSLADVSANLAYDDGNYTSFGIGASGGSTFSTKGGSIHSGGGRGGSRLIVDTDGVAGVPVDHGASITNSDGIGVVTDISSYNLNTINVDFNKLPDDIEAKDSVVEVVLTEGAIGYRHLEAIKGIRFFATIKYENGEKVGFGNSVVNQNGQEVGIVSDDGLAWLSGIQELEKLTVGKGSDRECTFVVPKQTTIHNNANFVCQSNK
jgi:outer membrane usher protein PapC